MSSGNKGPEIVTVAVASDEHPRHSEGTVVERADGSLMLVWMEYTRNRWGSADFAPNRLAAMVSHDHGRTWGDPRVLVDRDAGDVNVYGPSLLWMPNHELLLFYRRYHELAGGKAPVSSGFVCRSRDEGKTFSASTAAWTRQPLCSASAVARRLSTGRLIHPVGRQVGAIWSPTDHEVGGCLFSDDDGLTWQSCRDWVDLPLRGTMEHHIEELRDGRLLMVMRTQLGAVFQSHSEDGGVSWSKPQTTGLRAPESCPELTRIPQTGHLLIAWNNSPYDPGFKSHYGKRSPLTVAVSKDEGASWSHVRDVETDPRWAFSNPSCAFTRRGEAILTYWAMPYSPDWRMGGLMDLKAAIFDVEWLYG